VAQASSCCREPAGQGGGGGDSLWRRGDSEVVEWVSTVVPFDSGWSATVAGGKLRLLHHQKREGKVRLRGKMENDSRMMIFTGEWWGSDASVQSR
jgi:hypothetical protein